MIYFQKWEKGSFEYNFLNEIKKHIKEKPYLKLYIGFDYGFFCGMNIYYGSNHDSKHAHKLLSILNENKFNVRLFTNIDYDFDVILLLGYTNNKKERQYLWKIKKKLMKALSFF